MGCACGIGYGASTEYLMGGVMMGIKMSTWPMTALVLVLLLAVVSARQLLNQSESIFAAARPEASAAETLRKYVELRLHNADWKDYSKLVTWPDEPGWDCNWVVDKYSVGTERKRGPITVVPVR